MTAPALLAIPPDVARVHESLDAHLATRTALTETHRVELLRHDLLAEFTALGILDDALAAETENATNEAELELLLRSIRVARAAGAEAVAVMLTEYFASLSQRTSQPT